MAKHDWTTLRETFIAGTQSTRAFSKAKDIPYPTLEKRATAEGWTTLRERHRADVAKEARRKAIERKSEIAVTIDHDAIELANELFNQVRALLKNQLTPQEVGAIMALLERAQRVARIAQGLPTTITQAETTTTVQDGNIASMAMPDWVRKALALEGDKLQEVAGEIIERRKAGEL